MICSLFIIFSIIVVNGKMNRFAVATCSFNALLISDTLIATVLHE
jgi:hypothetical protein